MKNKRDYLNYNDLNYIKNYIKTENTASTTTATSNSKLGFSFEKFYSLLRVDTNLCHFIPHLEQKSKKGGVSLEYLIHLYNKFKIA